MFGRLEISGVFYNFRFGYRCTSAWLEGVPACVVDFTKQFSFTSKFSYLEAVVFTGESGKV